MPTDPEPFDEPGGLPEEEDLQREILTDEIARAMPGHSWITGGEISGTVSSTTDGDEEEEAAAVVVEPRTLFRCMACLSLILCGDEDATLPRCYVCRSRRWQMLGTLPLLTHDETEEEEVEE